MTSTTPPVVRPTAAERARTVASRPSAAVCAAGVSGSRVLAHATTRTGQVLLVVPTDGELVAAVCGSAEGDLPALVMVTDHAPADAPPGMIWIPDDPVPITPMRLPSRSTSCCGQRCA